jgi:predicted nicotinamide N-methyase
LSTASHEAEAEEEEVEEECCSIDSACLDDFLGDFGGDVPAISTALEQADAAPPTSSLPNDAAPDAADEDSPEMLKARLSQCLRCTSSDGSDSVTLEANQRWLSQLRERCSTDLALASVVKSCGIALLCRISDSVSQLASDASSLCDAVLAAPDSKAFIAVNSYSFSLVVDDSTALGMPDNGIQLDPSTLKVKRAELWHANGQMQIEEITLQTAPLYDRVVSAETNDPHYVPPPLEITHSRVWGCSILLSTWLFAHPWLLRGKSVLELGSGCGLMGIAAACCGPHECILTDFSDNSLDMIRTNVNLNAASNNRLPAICKICKLDWFKPLTIAEGFCHPGTFDVILASEIFYEKEHGEAVASTILARLSTPGLCVIINTAADRRFGASEFAQAMQTAATDSRTDHREFRMEYTQQHFTMNHGDCEWMWPQEARGTGKLGEYAEDNYEYNFHIIQKFLHHSETS